MTSTSLTQKNHGCTARTTKRRRAARRRRSASDSPAHPRAAGARPLPSGPQAQPDSTDPTKRLVVRRAANRGTSRSGSGRTAFRSEDRGSAGVNGLEGSRGEERRSAHTSGSDTGGGALGSRLLIRVLKGKSSPRSVRVRQVHLSKRLKFRTLTSSL